MSNVKADVFIITGGTLQALNTLEAKSRFCRGTGPCVLVAPRSQERLHHILSHTCELSSVWQWDEILWVDEEPFVKTPSRWQSLMQLRQRLRSKERALRQYRNCSRVFLGPYVDSVLHLANYLNPKQVVYLGDGLETLNSASRRVNRSLLPKSLRSMASKIFHDCVVGCYSKPPEVLTHFLPIQPPIRARDVFLLNSYPFLKSAFAKEKLIEGAAFLGQPIYHRSRCEACYYTMDIEYYISSLRLAVEALGGRSLCYYPHPKEDPSLVELVCAEAGITFVSYKAPIELELLLLPKLPKHIVSHWSSALLTCCLLFGELDISCCFLDAPPDVELNLIPVREALVKAGIKKLTSRQISAINE